MSTEELSEEEMVQAIYAFAAEQMQQGAPPHAIENALVEKGLDQESASTVVANLTEMRDEANVKSGKKNMIFGAPRGPCRDRPPLNSALKLKVFDDCFTLSACKKNVQI